MRFSVIGGSIEMTLSRDAPATRSPPLAFDGVHLGEAVLGQFGGLVLFA